MWAALHAGTLKEEVCARGRGTVERAGASSVYMSVGTTRGMGQDARQILLLDPPSRLTSATVVTRYARRSGSTHSPRGVGPVSSKGFKSQPVSGEGKGAAALHGVGASRPATP